ncbi:MAG: MotA/TolQ/ExbB proton channel family protein [Planctomycetaceae bacterium]
MNMLVIVMTLLLIQAPTDGAAPPGTASETQTPNGGGTQTANAATTDDATVDAPEGSTEETGSSIGSVLSDIASSGALGLMIEGGLYMWPILLLGIIGAGVIIERFRSLKMLSTDSNALRQNVQELLLADQVEEALRLCDREQGPVPAILSAGLRKFFVLRRLNYDADRIREQVVKAMDDYNVHVVAALERHLSILATIASVAPMVGFLGTVAGMILSFDNIDTNFGNENIVKLAAGGIKVALLTTAFGLIVGIPAFMAFNYFTSVIDRFVLDVEESATELIEVVTIQTAMDQASKLAPAANVEG